VSSILGGLIMAKIILIVETFEALKKLFCGALKKYICSRGKKYEVELLSGDVYYKTTFSRS
jgi:hypothetical protein